MKIAQLVVAAATGVRVRLVDWANWALSCSHRHTSFPLSVRTGGLYGDQPTPPPRVYVVCLACGQRLNYAGTKRATAWWGGDAGPLHPKTWRSLERHPHRGLK